MVDDPRQRYRQLLEQSLSAQDPTGWFDRLYTEAESGRAAVPWDRHAPHPLLALWARRFPAGGGRALVVGCGPGDDAELVAALGFDTVAFDVSAAAIRAARERYPSSKVDYVVADLFDPPAAWSQAFDLVVEVYTVQALCEVDLSVQAGELVAVMGPSGSGKSTLLTIAGTLEEPTGGQVAIGGRDLPGLSRNELARLRRRAIGYVFQDFNLLPG